MWSPSKYLESFQDYTWRFLNRSEIICVLSRSIGVNELIQWPTVSSCVPSNSSRIKLWLVTCKQVGSTLSLKLSASFWSVCIFSSVSSILTKSRNIPEESNN